VNTYININFQLTHALVQQEIKKRETQDKEFLLEIGDLDKEYYMIIYVELK